MNLQKRDCPVEIRVLPGGDGWTYIEWFVPAVMDKPLKLTASYLSSLFGDFILALYYLYPNQFENERGDKIVDFKFATHDSDTGKIIKVYDEHGAIHGCYTDVPYRAKFHWCEEPGVSTWTLTREPTEDTSFTVKLNLRIESGFTESDTFEYNYEFEYRDLCYAVAKAMTDVIKAYGFYGYYFSTSDAGIDMYHLLFIKAIALGCMDVRKLKEHGNYGYSTDFDSEIKLLVFDM